jgi:regulator of replication initiation timing
MTNFNGQTILDSIIEQNYPIETTTATTFDDDFAIELVENISIDRINKSQVILNNGVENGGYTISLEVAPYQLPLRYINEYKKLIHPEEEIDPVVLLIFESADISNSHMKIENLGTLEEFVATKPQQISELKVKIYELYDLDKKLAVENIEKARLAAIAAEEEAKVAAEEAAKPKKKAVTKKTTKRKTAAKKK